MNVPTTYAIVKELHPNEMAHIVRKLRAGKSKEREQHPIMLEWYYSWALRINCGTLGEQLSGAAHLKQQERLKAFNYDHVAETLDRVSCSLHAKLRRWWGACSFIDPKYIPPGVRDAVVEHVRMQNEAIARTPRKDLPELLAELSKDPGFIAIKIGNKEKP